MVSVRLGKRVMRNVRGCSQCAARASPPYVWQWAWEHTSPQPRRRIRVRAAAWKTILSHRGPKKAWQISIRIQSIWGVTKQILELVSKWSEMFNASNKEIYFEGKKPQRQLLWLLHASSSLLPHPPVFSGQRWGKNGKAKFRKVILSYMKGNKTMWEIWVTVSDFCRIL